MRPNVALSPTSPQYDAGRTLEPIVWLPSANGTIRAATAAAEPLDDPPGVHARFHGLRVGAGSLVANSVVFGGVELAEQDPARGLEPGHRGRVVRRDEAGHHLRAAL